MSYTKSIIKKLISKKFNNMMDDLSNFICDFIFEDINDHYITVHYETILEGDIHHANCKINWKKFIEGFMKCILHKKYGLMQNNVVPFLRNDISYFKNEHFYDTELENFITFNPLTYLFYYEQIYEYINSYTTKLSLGKGDQYKMFVIYYYNKDNSLNRILNKIY